MLVGQKEALKKKAFARPTKIKTLSLNKLENNNCIASLKSDIFGIVKTYHYISY